MTSFKNWDLNFELLKSVFTSKYPCVMVTNKTYDSKATRIFCIALFTVETKKVLVFGIILFNCSGLPKDCPFLFPCEKIKISRVLNSKFAHVD